MPNYQHGKIYKIISDQTDKIYIGSTTNKYLCSRLAVHKTKYKYHLEGKDKIYVTSYEIIKFGDAKIVLLELVPCNSKDELHARERHWIESLPNTVNKQRKMNYTIEDRKNDNKAYREENKDKIRACSKVYREENKDKLQAYREANKDKLRAYKKEYQLLNKDKTREHKKKYREKNRDKIRAYDRQYRASHKADINDK